MTSAEIQNLITDMLCRQKLLTTDEITPATRLVEDLAMDSLDLAELFTMIQQKTGRQFSAHSLSAFDTVESLAKSVLAADATVAGPTLSCPTRTSAERAHAVVSPHRSATNGVSRC